MNADFCEEQKQKLLIQRKEILFSILIVEISSIHLLIHNYKLNI